MERDIIGGNTAAILNRPVEVEGGLSYEQNDSSLECLYEFAEIIAKQDSEILELKSQLEHIKADLERSLENCYIDCMTGCFSIKMYERIKSEQFDPERDKNKIAIVFIDANGLSEINNRPIELGGGHDAGDRMIQDMATYLRHSFRVEDVVIRPYASGDEFVIVIRNHQNDINFEKNLHKRVGEIRRATKSLHLPFSFATGMAVLSDETNLDDLKQKAESRMYKCKKRMYACEKLKNKSH